jgi:HD-like signal output (HDOD) protein
MLKQLFNALGLRQSPPPTSAKPTPVKSVPQEGGGQTPGPPAEAKQPVAAPDAEVREFYAGLMEVERGDDLQRLAPDDRVFVAGVLKAVRERRLEIPVLPQAALEISRLLSDPAASASQFAKVLESDPGLSMDVLRIANSAYYGFSAATTSVRTAVVRIGLTQLRGLIIVTHLHGKVLQGGALARQAGWLSELSLGLAHLAQILAPELGVRPDAAFTRGVLSYVEHFVILGSVAEVSREHRRRIEPSSNGLHEAFARCGTQVRELAAQEWGVKDLLLSGSVLDEFSERFGQLQRALLAAWAGADSLFPVAGIPPERLAAAIERVSSARSSAGRRP